MSADICLFARPYLAPRGEFDAFLEVAQIADRAGIRSIAFGEHLVMAEATDRYPFGRWIHPIDSAWHDPLISLSAVAAVTDRLRLSTGVLIAPLRAALVLAKQVATLDVVSHGRVELGIGTGWQDEEYRGVGLAWADRQRRFDEVIRTCRLAWGAQPFAIAGDGATLGPLRAYPRPVQERIPVLYGVQANPSNARRIAELGDGWTPVAVTTEDVARGVGLLRTEFERIGRDPATLRVRVALPPAPLREPGAVEAMFAHAPELVEVGVTELVVGFNDRLDSVSQARELIEAVAVAAALVPDPTYDKELTT